MAYDGTNWVPYANPTTQPGGLLQTLAYDIWQAPVVTSTTVGNPVTHFTADITVTPKSTNSKFIVTFDAEFRISGNGGDEFLNLLSETTSGVTSRFIRQTSVSQTSEMGRSNVLLPITGFFNNTDLNPKTFRMAISRNAGDDLVYVWNGIVIIQEVSN